MVRVTIIIWVKAHAVVFFVLNGSLEKTAQFVISLQNCGKKELTIARKWLSLFSFANAFSHP